MSQPVPHKRVALIRPVDVILIGSIAGLGMFVLAILLGRI